MRMDFFTGLLIYAAGVGSCWIYFSYKTGQETHKLTEEFNQYKVSTTSAIMDLTKLINSNISTVGNANHAITEVKKDLVCFTEKIDRTDQELDNLQEHCVKLRESIIDVREIVASKRPIHRHDPIQVTLSPGILNPEMVKKTKKQIKEFEQ